MSPIKVAAKPRLDVTSGGTPEPEEAVQETVKASKFAVEPNNMDTETETKKTTDLLPTPVAVQARETGEAAVGATAQIHGLGRLGS